MSERLPDDTIKKIVALFESGHTYRQISALTDLPLSCIAATLCSFGLHREAIQARRVAVNELAMSGMHIDEIAGIVGLQANTVKILLRKARIKYTLAPKEGQS